MQNMENVRKVIEEAIDSGISPNDIITDVITIIEQKSGEKVKYYAEVSKEERLEKEIVDILREMHILPTMKGYECIKSAIILVYNNPLAVSMRRDVYPIIAEMYSRTELSVETSIRYAIKRAWEESELSTLRTFFGNSISYRTPKPTNAAFICAIAMKLLYE